MELCDIVKYPYVFCADPDRTLYPLDVDVEDVAALDVVVDYDFISILAFAILLATSIYFVICRLRYRYPCDMSSSCTDFYHSESLSPLSSYAPRGESSTVILVSMQQHGGGTRQQTPM